MSRILADFFYHLPTHFVRVFRGKNLVWHTLAVLLTYLLVTSGFDWWYFESTRNATLFTVAIGAALLGFLVPMLGPVGLYLFGKKKLGSALGQAAILGWLISSLYKAFTGRLHPEMLTGLPSTDISTIFHFGFLREGIFWGWPSSHTAVAFAMTAALCVLYRRNKKVIVPAVLYALYIGLGVSLTIHWFSDFVAGAIIGTVVGVIVGKGYRDSLVA